jgi:hypothetical protein
MHVYLCVYAFVFYAYVFYAYVYWNGYMYAWVVGLLLLWRVSVQAFLQGSITAYTGTHIYIYIYIYIYIHTHTHTHTNTHTHAHKYIHIHAHMHTPQDSGNKPSPYGCASSCQDPSSASMCVCVSE